MKRSSFLKSLLGIAIAPLSVAKSEKKYSYFEYFDKIIANRLSHKDYIDYGIPIDIYFESNDYLKFNKGLEYFSLGGDREFDTFYYGGFKFYIHNLDRLKK